MAEKRMCENCRTAGRSTAARYREVYDDLTGTDVCEEHLMSEDDRKKWFASGQLERLYDYTLGKEIHPVTLRR